MPAVYVSPGGSSSLPIFQSSTHVDQLGLNVAPTNQTFYVETSSHSYMSGYFYTHILQTDRDYAGADTIRAGKGGIQARVILDNNDPTWNPVTPIGIGVNAIVYSGVNSPSYGTPIAFSGQVYARQVPTPHSNEYSVLFACIVAGSYDAPISGGNYWFFDNAVHGPSGGQPGILSGYSLVTNNYYNGSPQFGAAVGVCLQTAPKIGPQYALMCQGTNPANVSATTYPWDVGYFISGYSTGGTGDGYTNAVQVGGLPGPWMGTGNTNYGGDVGQVARGVVVKAKNAGTSVARLGAMVSEGIGEGGGLVFGLDTNDANRVSVFRSASGVLELNGKLCLSGEAASTTATPSNVAGKVPIYTSSGTLIGYLPVYGSL